MRRIALRLLVPLLALVASGLFTATPAFADRNFPERAKRGEMKAYEYPFMKIGDRTLRLSAGSRIFNEHNLIIMPASLQKQSAAVMFSTDINGELSEVWLLTAQEAKARPLPTILPAPGGTGRRQQ
jgi:hypothetical protein